MARDDYDVIVYKVLVYLYACMKHKIIFEEETFDKSVREKVDNDDYFINVLRMMQDEGLLERLTFVNVWGGDVFLTSDIKDARITSKGIHYLEENERMHRVGNWLKESVDIIAKLASLAGLSVNL